MKIISPVCLILLVLLAGCHTAGSPPAAESEDTAVQAVVPVKSAPVNLGPISSAIELNATSSFLKRNIVRSTVTGYIQSIKNQLGDPVSRGRPLFILETKEARVLGNNLFPDDPALKFSGLISIRASQSGYITTMNHQLGDYVQEGDSLCSIVDQSSLVFMLNVPFELNTAVKMNQSCEIILPDGRTFPGTVYSRVAVMDAASQTQRYLIKSRLPRLPENLIARVKMLTIPAHTALLVPHAAVLTNEEQTEFWVMKVAGPSLAVKVMIKKGIENPRQTEVLNSTLKEGDRVLISGNYGIADSARIKIEK